MKKLIIVAILILCMGCSATNNYLKDGKTVPGRNHHRNSMNLTKDQQINHQLLNMAIKTNERTMKHYGVESVHYIKVAGDVLIMDIVGDLLALTSVPIDNQIAFLMEMVKDKFQKQNLIKSIVIRIDGVYYNTYFI